MNSRNKGMSKYITYFYCRTVIHGERQGQTFCQIKCFRFTRVEFKIIRDFLRLQLINFADEYFTFLEQLTDYFGIVTFFDRCFLMNLRRNDNCDPAGDISDDVDLGDKNQRRTIENNIHVYIILHM